MTTESLSKMFPYENPSPEEIKRLQEDIGMTEDTLKEDLRTLKEWLQKQPHLPNVTDEKLLRRFLYFCKNSIEKTKMKLDLYFSTRAANPEYFSNRDPENAELKASAKAVFFCVLPKLTKDFDRVAIMKIFDPDVNKFNPTIVFKLSFMCADAHLPKDECRSHILVYDMKHGSIGHVGSITIPIIRKFFNSALQGMPLTHSSFHIINAPPFAESLITIGKSFLKDKLAKRVYIHSSPEGLHKFIPKESLPEEYGGTFSKTMEELRDIDYAALIEHKEWFKEQESLITDESKRLAKMNSVDHVEGSFRKINID